MYIEIISRKVRYTLLLILSAVLIGGCSGEQSQAKRLILEAFPNRQQ